MREEHDLMETEVIVEHGGAEDLDDLVKDLLEFFLLRGGQ